MCIHGFGLHAYPCVGALSSSFYYTHSQDDGEHIDVDIAIQGAANKVVQVRKLLEDRYGGSIEDPAALHASIAERTNLILRVQQLLQEGGFGDSSDEEVDEDAAAENRLRRKMTPAAKSQPSDTLAAPPPPEPLAPQARAFMAEKGFHDLATEDTTVTVECCTDASERRLH